MRRKIENMYCKIFLESNERLQQFQKNSNYKREDIQAQISSLFNTGFFA